MQTTLVRVSTIFLSTLLISACSSSKENTQTHAADSTTQTSQNGSTSQNVNQQYQIQRIAAFNEPWALTKLPDGRLLITEKSGQLKLFDPKTKTSLNVEGIPKVAYGGQGGLGDIILHPEFKNNHWIYLSYAEQGTGGYGAVVLRAKLDLSDAQKPKITDQKRIWEQVPKMSGQGHYGHRLMFDRDGKLWIASGERQHFDPAQDMQSNLGKVLRLNDDGTPAQGNPFADQGAVQAQIWSLGHRNPLGITTDKDQRVWVVEMGPEGGDELNLIQKSLNYGYPIVSDGDHYDGTPIPNHHTRPEFEAPKLAWTPVISPSSMIVYHGTQFPLWKDKAIIGGLSSKAIVIVDLMQTPVKEVQRLDMGERIRGVLEADDGSLWVIEDGSNAGLLRLTAK